MRVALLALMLTFATQADAWFDIFAKEKFLICLFKESARFKAPNAQTFILKGDKVTVCSPDLPWHKSIKVENQRVTKTSIYVECNNDSYRLRYEINRVTGRVIFRGVSDTFEGICTLRDEAFKF
jgi:hypothetical protein